MLNKSWQLGEIAGIGVFLHWSFLFLPVLIGCSALLSGGLAAAIVSVIFVLAIFGCVVLHEVGHALAARRFGIATQDITLLPIGGLARLERMPKNPKQELAIALAGPAVNVAIAVALFLLLMMVGAVAHPASLPLLSGSFPARLMWANVGLVVFNLLPAFPMDGGRVLRSLLAMRMPHLQATEIAASVGQFMAIAFGCLGFLGGHFGLMLVAAFVFLAARGETEAAQAQAAWPEIEPRTNLGGPPLPPRIVIAEIVPQRHRASM